MAKFSRYPISKLYDFFEKKFLKDYENALAIISDQIQLNKEAGWR